MSEKTVFVPGAQNRVYGMLRGRNVVLDAEICKTNKGSGRVLSSSVLHKETWYPTSTRQGCNPMYGDIPWAVLKQKFTRVKRMISLKFICIAVPSSHF